MSEYISVQLRKQIAAIDYQRCCYCLTSESNSGISMTYDHIYPRSKGGETCLDNVCLACSSCNMSKSDNTEALDLSTKEIVSLFNPRKQKWSDHFAWTADKTKLEGITPSGRVTVATLRMNRPTIVIARQRWVRAGWHPPPR